MRMAVLRNSVRYFRRVRFSSKHGASVGRSEYGAMSSTNAGTFFKNFNSKTGLILLLISGGRTIRRAIEQGTTTFTRYDAAFANETIAGYDDVE